MSTIHQGDVFAQYGRNLAKDMHGFLEARAAPVQSLASKASAAWNRHHATPTFDTQSRHDGVIPVGIIGGGMAGLYAGLQLAQCGIPFQILEASDRVGGRCLTYKFDEGDEYDYFDVGPMRFPLPPKGQTGAHTRLRKLFDLLKIDLFDNIIRTDQSLLYYNGIHATTGDKNPSFNAEELGIPKCYVDCGTNALWSDFINPLGELLLKDAKTGGGEGWEEMKRDYDQYSVRAYLQFKYIPSKGLQKRFGIPATPLSVTVVDWMETYQGSGLFDRGVTETVLEALAFGEIEAGPQPEWHCIDGGASVLPKACLLKIKKWAKNIEGMPSEVFIKNSPVTAIYPSDLKDKKSPLVVVTSGGKKHSYSHVISTVPLPNFARIDTSTLDISLRQAHAIRSLGYTPATKVGILFKTAWWKEHKQVGGQSHTDLPIRTIVYPSYGQGQSSRVLIASYCWTNDANKLGNLIDTGADDVLKEVVLRNLATIHQVDVKVLEEQFVEMHAFNWNHNAWGGGAYGSFGPGQYAHIYGALNAPAADGRLQWAGEILSVRHGWIEGALDSAWAAVVRYLYLSNASPDSLHGFYDTWDINWEWHDASPAEDPKRVERRTSSTKGKSRTSRALGNVWADMKKSLSPGAGNTSNLSKVPCEDIRKSNAGGTDTSKVPRIPHSENLLLRHILLHTPDLLATRN
ncbi:amine oxidase [Coprinopsis cinerea okayama7|uniref:Amine oxidase n=1 Tax=Coprinopsis cinerea (strain Okayama-7 / 130 / ATCC MYA-4618 / FGSC 9003) TaxID=240176 RepID=A8NIC0_COPC7|nr:amine oxidase [Coprinopsis cinerea okayama7\|eukprot:XP_001833962.1 amine oxidase [Coprinopsis cinerea okayama7\